MLFTQLRQQTIKALDCVLQKPAFVEMFLTRDYGKWLGAFSTEVSHVLLDRSPCSDCLSKRVKGACLTGLIDAFSACLHSTGYRSLLWPISKREPKRSAWSRPAWRLLGYMHCCLLYSCSLCVNWVAVAHPADINLCRRRKNSDSFIREWTCPMIATASCTTLAREDTRRNGPTRAISAKSK